MYLLIQLEESDVISTQQVIDRNTYGSFQPQQYGFSFAFGIQEELDPQYGYYSINKVFYYYDSNRERKKEKVSLEFGECGNQYFNYENQTFVELTGINKYMCLYEQDYELEGDFYSENFQYLEISLFKCTNSSYEESISNNTISANYTIEEGPLVCKSEEEIVDYFNGKQFNWAFVNSYFDALDYEQPIKYTIDDSLFFILDSSRTMNANLFVMGAEVELEDDLFQYGQSEEIEFYTVMNVRTYDIPKSSYASQTYLTTFFIRIDKQYEIYNRSVYSILEMLGNVGGLQSIFFFVGLIFVQFYQRRSFVSHVIRNIYQIKKDQEQNNNQLIKKSTKQMEKEHKFQQDLIKQQEKDLYNELNHKKRLDEDSFNQILQTIISRKRLFYNTKNIIEYVLKCFCIRNLQKIRHNPKIKKHIYYQNAEGKLQYELDIVTLIKSIKRLNLICQVLLSQRHRILLKFQKQNLIVTSEEEYYSSGKEDQYILNQFESKDPYLRLMVFGKIKKIIETYKTKNMERVDLNLIKGLYKNKIKDFDEDLFQKNENRTLYSRLTNQNNLKVSKENSNLIDKFKSTRERSSKNVKINDNSTIRTNSVNSVNNEGLIKNILFTQEAMNQDE